MWIDINENPPTPDYYEVQRWDYETETMYEDVLLWDGEQWETLDVMCWRE